MLQQMKGIIHHLRELVAAALFLTGTATVIIAFAIGTEAIEAKITFVAPIMGIVLGLVLAAAGWFVTATSKRFLGRALSVFLFIMSIPLLYVVLTVLFLGVAHDGEGSKRELLRVGSMAALNLAALIVVRTFLRARGSASPKNEQ